MITTAQVPVSCLYFDFSPSPATGGDATDIRDSLREVRSSLMSVYTLRGEAVSELQDVYLDCRYSNWDGYEARAVTHEAYLQTKQFLDQVLDSCPPPTASATPSGSLTLEWVSGPRRRFIVSLDGQTEFAFAGVFGWETVQGTAAFSGDVPSVVFQHLSRVYLA